MAISIWRKTSATKHRLQLMRGMKDLGIGFNEDEAYVKRLVGQGVINRTQGKIEKGILGLALEAKIGDQRQSLRNLKDQQGVIRGELTMMCGRGTMAYRRSLRKLKRVGRAEDKYQSSRLSLTT